ncbi:MAG: ribonuclease E activity regulator RraA [Sulfurospirillum sp.]|nr:ribonuclease E activity regulator RraA [Sulfurospirillum sp.]
MTFQTSDLCDKYDNTVQVLTPLLHSFGGTNRCFGQIVTCKLPDHNYTLKQLLQTSGDGKVCVVDVNAKFTAVVGDTLMAFAAQNNWAGIIINGYVRDTINTKKINVALFALGTCPKKTQLEKKGVLGETLHFAGVDFCDGDFLYADEDGIITSKEMLYM